MTVDLSVGAHVYTYIHTHICICTHICMYNSGGPQHRGAYIYTHIYTHIYILIIYTYICVKAADLSFAAQIWAALAVECRQNFA